MRKKKANTVPVLSGEALRPLSASRLVANQAHVRDTRMAAANAAAEMIWASDQ